MRTNPASPSWRCGGRIYSCNLTPVPDHDYVNIYGLEITARKLAEDTLRIFQKAVENSLDAIGMSTPEGRHVYQNKAFTRLFGLSVQQTHGSAGPPSTIYADEAVGREVFAVIMQGGVWEGEVVMLDREGNTIDVALRAYSIKDDRGDVIGLVGVHTDITERKRMELALQDSLAQAQAATRAKSRFLANMSHEIRTPMSGLLGMATLLSRTTLDDEQKQYVQMLTQSGERLLAVINDILDISRIESGRMEKVEKRLHIRQLVHSVLTPIVARAHHKGLSFTIDVSGDIPEPLIGDPGRIAQVLTNLADNAVKFTRTGAITVTCSHSELESSRLLLQMTVADTGIGIPADKLTQIFEPFFQVDGSFSREFGGTGLGLAIARQLSELMDGTLTIESEMGKGTSCILTIPMVIAVPEPTSEARLTTPGLERTGARVLIAEDDHVSAILMRTYMNKLGIEADIVRSGHQVIERLRSGTYDLVLMDCEMPEIDGYAASREIRQGAAGEAAKNTPIIAQTAYAMDSDKKKCLEAGMNDYLSKPLDYPALVSVLNTWLPAT